MISTVYIIEHLEPEVFAWCVMEYKHISSIVGKERLWFTNLKGKKGAERLEGWGKCVQESVRELSLKNMCVLDPAVEETLEPKEAKAFAYFIFGGILGDDPPKERTKEELTPFVADATVRNIGKAQMSTDNAVFVVHAIAHGKTLKEIPFQEGAEIEINDVESIQLPYTYAVVKGKPLMSEELVEYLKKKETF